MRPTYAVKLDNKSANETNVAHCNETMHWVGLKGKEFCQKVARLACMKYLRTVMTGKFIALIG